MSYDNELEILAAHLGQALLQRGWSLVTAESCTGGWIAQAITAIPGSSQWFDRGFVTYSNQAKIELLGVDPAVLHEHGAVSIQTVAAMTQGALVASDAEIAVAVSGIAGPTGATPDKPVGRVYVAWQKRQETALTAQYDFAGDRRAVRRAAVQAALAGLLDLAS